MISFYPARCLIHLLSLPEHIQAAADIVDYPHVDNGPVYFTTIRGGSPPTHMPLWLPGLAPLSETPNTLTPAPALHFN